MPHSSVLLPNPRICTALAKNPRSKKIATVPICEQKERKNRSTSWGAISNALHECYGKLSEILISLKKLCVAVSSQSQRHFISKLH